MAIASKLVARKREKLGTAECRRLRRQNVIPGNIYGHRQDPLPIAVAEEDLKAAIASGHHVVDLEMDGSTESAIFREVQWDTFGIKIHHFDLLRVDADERVEVEVTVELKGTAPGVLNGGVAEHHLRTLTVECPAVQIPDSIQVRISSLDIGQGIHVNDLELPEGMVVLDNPEELIVQVIQPVEAPAIEEETAAPTEPEVIREKRESAEKEE